MFHGTWPRKPEDLVVSRTYLKLRVERYDLILEVVPLGPVPRCALLPHVLAGAGAVSHRGRPGRWGFIWRFERVIGIVF